MTLEEHNEIKSIYLNKLYFDANKKFDLRHRELVLIGFERIIIQEYNLAVYVKTDALGKKTVIQSAHLSFAPDEIFEKMINDSM